MNKTVYILGAGFSMSANAPSQEKLVEKIFELDLIPNVFMDGKVAEFKQFLSTTLMIPEVHMKDVPLEDIFTPLDRCILDNISFRNLSIDEVRGKRDLVYYLIGRTLQYILNNNPEKEYINRFARHLVKSSSARKNKNYSNVDNVSVITTNWDILLDTSIQTEIDKSHYLKAVVDYCCHISSFDKNDERIKPGLEVLGRGDFNVKVLKLHGSLNWLQCQRCQRLYVDGYDKIAVNQYLHHEFCRHCNENFDNDFNCESHRLSPNLIMPTFLKNLSNPQYKLIWQNAGIELSEASKIVFIGYSLPYADFEMRQLLSRMVRSDAEVEVVGYSNDPACKEAQEFEKRYRVFFGDRIKKAIDFRGAKEYLLESFPV